MNIKKIAPILTALVRSAICKEGPARLAEKALNASDWKDLLRLATRHEVGSLLRAGILRSAVSPPDTVTSALRRQAIAWELRNAKALGQLEEVLSAFDRGAIPTITLKGALFAAAYYPAPGSRSFSDIDILVPLAQRDQAARILLDLGYTLFQGAEPQGAGWWTENHHHWVFRRKQCLSVELHWDLTPPSSRVQFDMAQFLKDSRDIVTAGGNLRALRPEDQILYLATHSATHQLRLPIRQYIDLAVIVSASPEIDWPYVAEQARQVGVTKDLAVFLGTASHLGLISLSNEVTAYVTQNGLEGASWDSLATYALLWPFIATPASLLEISAASSPGTKWQPLRQLISRSILRKPQERRSRCAGSVNETGATATWRARVERLCAKLGGVVRNRDQVKTAMLIAHHFSEREAP